MFTFNERLLARRSSSSGQLIILPEHVWSKVDGPGEVHQPRTRSAPARTPRSTRFQTQSYELRKNPNYWQPEKQKIAGIRMLAFAGNDGANLAAANGEVDWAPQFIPTSRRPSSPRTRSTTTTGSRRRAP